MYQAQQREDAELELWVEDLIAEPLPEDLSSSCTFFTLATASCPFGCLSSASCASNC